jgi:hypothetical protein
MHGKVPRGIVNLQVTHDPRWQAKLRAFGTRFGTAGETKA